jgi:serine/threonine protein phosphatase PrpC
MGSDGLFDNLYDDDLQPCLIQQISHSQGKFTMQDPTAAADCLAKRAYAVSKDKNYLSPFAKGARESFRNYNGGKEDDITVIVAQIKL